MRDFWNNLSDRERLLIIGGGVVLALFILLQGVISPVMNWRGDQRRALERSQSLYELVAEAAGRAGGAPVGGDMQAPLRNAIAQSAADADVNIIYVNVRADGAVEANAAQADPAGLFAWVQTVERDFGARLTSADIAREQSDVSKVRAQLTFTRGGA